MCSGTRAFVNLRSFLLPPEPPGPTFAHWHLCRSPGHLPLDGYSRGLKAADSGKGPRWQAYLTFKTPGWCRAVPMVSNSRPIPTGPGWRGEVDADSVGPGRVSTWPRALDSRYGCRWHLVCPPDVTSPVRSLQNTLLVSPPLHTEIIWGSFEKTSKAPTPSLLGQNPAPGERWCFTAPRGPRGVWPR